MVLPNSICALLHIATFAIFTQAQRLAFITPDFDNIAASGYPVLEIGSRVIVRWDTDFDETSLLVYQEVNGRVVYEVLAEANDRDNTSYTWMAGRINENPIVGAQFHFYLQNSQDSTCSNCYLNSRVFQLQTGNGGPNNPGPIATTISATGTTTPTSTVSAGGGSSSTAAAGNDSGGSSGGSSGDSPANTDGAASANGGSSSDSSDLGVGLGVGLGAGIPALLGLLVVLFMFLRRRRQMSNEASKAAAYDDYSSSETPQMQHNDNRFSRESGALGPYMANPSPNWEQQEALEQERWEREYQSQHQPSSRSPSHMSQKEYLPFEPMATHSEEHSRESSRHSWIDQFDFEQPGYRDADELSQVRRSIHEAPSARPAEFAQHADSHASISNVGDIPQLPELAHHSGPDDNWPLRY